MIIIASKCHLIEGFILKIKFLGTCIKDSGPDAIFPSGLLGECCLVAAWVTLIYKFGLYMSYEKLINLFFMVPPVGPAYIPTYFELANIIVEVGIACVIQWLIYMKKKLNPSFAPDNIILTLCPILIMGGWGSL